MSSNIDVNNYYIEELCKLYVDIHKYREILEVYSSELLLKFNKILMEMNDSIISPFVLYESNNNLFFNITFDGNAYVNLKEDNIYIAFSDYFCQGFRCKDIKLEFAILLYFSSCMVIRNKNVDYKIISISFLIDHLTKVTSCSNTLYHKIVNIVKPKIYKIYNELL